MVQIIFLLTTFIFYKTTILSTTVSNNTTSSPTMETPPIETAKAIGPTNLRKFIMAVEKKYKNLSPVLGLNAVASDMRRVWDEIRNGGHIHSSNDLDDLQRFLRRIVDDYNAHMENEGLDTSWQYYIIIFAKYYDKNEMKMRKAIFKKNKERVVKHNELFRKGNVSYSIKLNHLSDRTEEELEKMTEFRPHNHKKGSLQQNDTKRYSFGKHLPLPASVDWKAKGYVTPVRFQGDCSSCYAFSGIGALEALYKKKTGSSIRLSVQNILDCTWHLGNNGCSGGFIDAVFEYAQSDGVVLDIDYKYIMNTSHDCKWNKEHAIKTNEGYLAVSKRDEEALHYAVARHGPVAAVIGAPKDFHDYAYGVFSPLSCGSADHSVLIVGYGTDLKHGDYWLAKNSFGEWWGEDGYIRIARNKKNFCDVATHAVFPI